MTNIEAVTLKMMAERRGRIHFQLSPGELTVLLALEARGLVRAMLDGYTFELVKA